MCVILRRYVYDSVITKEVAEYALDLLEVDRLGLDKGDRAIFRDNCR